MGLWWDPFVQSRKCMGLKFTGEFCLIIMKNYEELRVMFDGNEYWYNIWKKTDLCFLKIFVYRLKSNNFILESKIAELNWKQNWFILKITRIFPILTSRNRLTDTFVIVFSYRQSIDRKLNILLMVNINPIKEIV